MFDYFQCATTYMYTLTHQCPGFFFFFLASEGKNTYFIIHVSIIFSWFLLILARPKMVLGITITNKTMFYIILWWNFATLLEKYWIFNHKIFANLRTSRSYFISKKSCQLMHLTMINIDSNRRENLLFLLTVFSWFFYSSFWSYGKKFIKSTEIWTLGHWWVKGTFRKSLII